MKNKNNIILINLKEVFSKKISWIIFILNVLIIGSIFFHFTNLDLIEGNFGSFYLYLQIIFQIVITLLFAIFMPISIYKFLEFNTISIKENVTSTIGTIFGLLVAGCPACSITLASYLGIASIVSFLPWYGLELKIIAVPLLLYANYSLLKDLKVCKIKNNIKNKIK